MFTSEEWIRKMKLLRNMKRAKLTILINPVLYLYVLCMLNMLYLTGCQLNLENKPKKNLTSCLCSSSCWIGFWGFIFFFFGVCFFFFSFHKSVMFHHFLIVTAYLLHRKIKLLFPVLVLNICFFFDDIVFLIIIPGMQIYNYVL